MACEMIQSAAQIVYCISGDQSSFGRWCHVSDAKLAVAGRWIGLTSESVRGRIDEAVAEGSEIIDVLDL